MVRVRPTAEVPNWLSSVAEVLPLPHQAPPPYALGEAVAELGEYAQAADGSTWGSRTSKSNRASLRTEIDAQAEALGGRLSVLLSPLLDEIRIDADPAVVVKVAARLSEEWHSQGAITDAFGDLCDAAKVSGVTTRALRKLSAIVASQVGPAAHSSFSLLNHAADALVGTAEELAVGRPALSSPQFSEADRLEMAIDILVAPQAGHVVVWLAYYRATVSGMREVAGPMTFLRADWVLPNAFDHELHDFAERAELRRIREHVYWLDELNAATSDPKNRLALVRVDLGERQVAGAAEEARRRVEAVLSVPVEAGGVSWQSADAVAVLLNGEVRSSSPGIRVHDVPSLDDDTYGIGATAEILTEVAAQLDEALSKGPMPNDLVEALNSLREARMTDHRDVLFYGARRVSPRVATALEDHAMELFASVLKVSAIDLAASVQRREALHQADSQVASQLMSPFRGSWSQKHHAGRREIERKISSFSRDGGLMVSIEKAVALQDEISALPMSELQRADLEEALAICTDPAREGHFLEQTRRDMGLIRARHRRVRNAVNHGLPLSSITLKSIRRYGDNTSSIALNMALASFKSGEPGVALLERESDAWSTRTDRIARGVSWAEYDAQAAADS